MSEKRFTDVNVDFEQSWIRLKDNGLFLIFPISFNDKEEYGLETLEDLLNGLSDKIDEQQATIEHLTKSRDKWSQSAKLHSEYFNCLEKAIERAYEEKPYPKIDDIMNIYSKLEKEVDDE